VGVLFTNNASTTLSAAISSTSATSISVASSSTFPAPGAGEYFYATIDDGTNNEIVKVTAVSGTTWTVVRASDNTTARTFSSGDTVQLRAAAALLTDIQQNIAAKSANQTVYNATTASSATSYDVGTNPQNENNAMVFLDGVMQHHDTFSFSGSTLTFDAAPSNGLKLEVIIDNLINLQSSNLTVDTFTATNGQTAFTLSDTPAAEDNLIVFIEGVFQNQDSYSISNNVLTMSAGVTTGRKVVVYVINPVNIGTPSDGTVTSAKLSGNITMPGTLTVGSNDVAFDSPTFVVDNANSRVGLGTASPSVPVDIVGDVKMSSTLDLTSHLDMPDNANVKLGTGDDLLLYHDGTNSYIANTTGALKIATETSGIAVTIGHTTSETTVADNLTVTGTITGTLATAAQTNITSLGTLTTLATRNDQNAETAMSIQNASTASAAHAELLLKNSNGNVGGLRAHGSGFTTSNSSEADGFTIESYRQNLHITASNDKDIKFWNGTSNNVVFKNGGNVGIGTNAPSRLLDIENSTAGGSTLVSLVSATDGNVQLLLGDTDSDTQGKVLYNNDGDYMTLNTNDAERIRIDSNGKVGIGTTTITALLTLADHDDGTMNEMIRLVNDPGSSTSVGTGVQITFANHHSGTEVASVRSIAETTGAGTGLQFYTHSGSALNEKLRINKNGNIFLTGGGTPTIPSGMASSSYVQLKIGGGILADSGHSSGHNIMLGNNVHVGASNDLKFTHAAAAAVINMTGGDINFRTHDGGGASADATATLDSRFYIKENGNIGVGTTSPSAPFHIAGGNPNSTADSVFHVSKTGANDFTCWLGSGADDYGLGIRGVGSYAWAVYDHNAGAYRARLQFGGDLYLQNTTVNSISDRRLKKNIVDANSQWNDIKALKWRNFEWKDEYIDGTYLGLIADEVESVSPNLVQINAQPKEDIDAGIPDPKHKTVKYSIVWMKAMKALQEAQERIETLEAKVQALESS
jgi:hypothetical protein